MVSWSSYLPVTSPVEERKELGPWGVVYRADWVFWGRGGRCGWVCVSHLQNELGTHVNIPWNLLLCSVQTTAVKGLEVA